MAASLSGTTGATPARHDRPCEARTRHPTSSNSSRTAGRSARLFATPELGAGPGRHADGIRLGARFPRRSPERARTNWPHSPPWLSRLTRGGAGHAQNVRPGGNAGCQARPFVPVIERTVSRSAKSKDRRMGPLQDARRTEWANDGLARWPGRPDRPSQCVPVVGIGKGPRRDRPRGRRGRARARQQSPVDCVAPLRGVALRPSESGGQTLGPLPRRTSRRTTLRDRKAQRLMGTAGCNSWRQALDDAGRTRPVNRPAPGRMARG